ncbi:MAG: PEP/pyruvate-binding domain-containing protein [Streptosporangiaceae bacterium]
MDLVWNNLLTCDYERTRPGAPRLELDLYTRSLTSWPRVLLGDPRPYGHLRRPGIIDIPRADHEALTSAWHQRLADPAYARSLIRQTADDREAAASRLDSLEHAIGAGDRPQADAAMEAATTAVLRVMSAHIVNWLLPEAEWEQFLASLLGGPGSARACMSAFQLPDAPGHILAVSQHDGGHTEARRTEALRLRDQWSSAAARAAAGDDAAAGQVTVISSLLEWAATSEERRKEIRERYLALARAWAAAAPLSFASLTAACVLREDAGPAGAIPLRDAADPAACGGKAAALSRLTRAGLPVPSGLVIPPGVSDGQLAALTAAVCGMFAAPPGQALAVRSSAADEDGPGASFAGVYATCFTPAEPEALLRAVRAVRASAHSPAALAYAEAHGLPGSPGMAVIIQPVLRPFAAGVLAARVHEGTVTDWAVQAVYGLAGPLADGSCAGEFHQPGQPPTPLDQEYAALPLQPGERGLPPGEWTHLPLPDGTSVPAKIRSSGEALLTAYLPDRITAAPLLSAALREELLSVAAKAAAALGLHAIDAEWAITPDGTIHLLQGRPLTADGTAGAIQAGPHHRSRSWAGIPGAPGQAAGPLIHIRDNDGHDPGAGAEGAVLVCGNIGPAAIRALLRKPAAILSTCGGPLSHAAIVARELGVPCVTAMPAAIRSLPEGTVLHVDGLAGTASPDGHGTPGGPAAAPGAG